MTEHNEATTTLNTLIATLIDSATGYEDAAKDVGNSELSQLFRTRAGERRAMVEEMRGQVTRLGGNPEDDGTILGNLHQRFMDLKAVVAGQDEKAVVNEVERGEDYLKAKFETALKSDALTGECRSTVERAFQSVQAGHDQASALKHSMDA